MADGSIFVAVLSASAALSRRRSPRSASPTRMAAKSSATGSNGARSSRGGTKKKRAPLAWTCSGPPSTCGPRVENNEGYQGPEMRSRLARVRQHASDAAVYAVLIGTIEPDVLAVLADKLAKAARNLEVAAAANTILEMNMSNEVPDLGELNDCIEAFAKRAVAYVKGEKQLSVTIASKLSRDLTMRR
jgi:hypothetical protein